MGPVTPATGCRYYDLCCVWCVVCGVWCDAGCGMWEFVRIFTCQDIIFYCEYNIRRQVVYCTTCYMYLLRNVPYALITYV